MSRSIDMTPDAVGVAMDAIWKELTSGSRLTERKREAQSAYTEIYRALHNSGQLTEPTRTLERKTKAVKR